MPPTKFKIGPKDHGRRMRLEDFDRAEGQPGHLYELGREVVTVVDVPNSRPFAQSRRMQADLESERHPDVAVYQTPPPEGEDVWATWVPELVIEVVSPGSERRDYEEKREEYLRFGVKEYWIVDAEKEEVLVLRRSRGRWVEQIVSPPEIYRRRLLPGFCFDCAAVFQAAR